MGKKKDAHLPEEVFLVLGKHTRVAALNATLEASFGAGVDPTDKKAWGRLSLRCSYKVADTLRKGIQVGGRSVRVESEEPTDDDATPGKPKTSNNGARGAGEGDRGGKGKGYGRRLQCCGCATHPWFQCKVVKYEAWKELCGKCGKRARLQELCEATRVSREWYI